MWILILTLLAGARQNPTMMQVPGFTSLATCQAAGNAWQQLIHDRGIRDNDYTAPSALCVKL